MANITKRGNSYQITVSCGYDIRGKQVRRTLSWKPPANMTEKQIEKEVQRQAVLFEEECNQGVVGNGNVKFEEFAEQWKKEYASVRLKEMTLRGYKILEPRTFKALGHIRIDKITTRDIQIFISSLINEKSSNNKKLSAKSIANYKGFISSILSHAVRMQLIPNNPCKYVMVPRLDEKEKDIYSLEEVTQMLTLFENEKKDNLKHVVFYTLALFTGFRKAELLGLEWKDVDFKNAVISVNRTSNWSKEKGTFTDTPKTKRSVRSLKVSTNIIDILNEYKEWQNNEIEVLGTKWEHHDRLFTQWNGKPMSHNASQLWFTKFCKRTGLRYVSLHSMRHLNATMLINAGLDVKTVQACLGHSEATTTMNTYLHTFNDAQTRAMRAVSDTLDLYSSKINIK